MAKKSNSTPEAKLRALYDLQVIDSMIDKIRMIRGELPLEVQDLEDEIAGLETRSQKVQDELASVDSAIAERKNAIVQANALIKKYNEQQDNVRNNREFESLNKEIEYQELEIQVCEKKINEYAAQKEAKGDSVEASSSRLKERQDDLEAKKGELEEIILENQREEQILVAKSQDMESVIEPRLLQAYKRIRGSAKNGLAVVPIDREASAGSFIKIPPQRQLDVAARKKIIVDEHSGRILVDKILAEEETEKIEKMIVKEMAASKS